MRKFVLAVLMPLLAPAANAEDWGGWYGGLGVVGSSDMIDYVDETQTYLLNGQPSPILDEDRKSASGAYALLGHMWQRESLVFGVELDLGGGKSTFVEPSPSSPPCSPDPCAIAGVYGSLQTQGHLRGVLGYSMGPGLVGFASLGVARAQLDVSGFWAGYSVDEDFGAGAGYGPPVPDTVYGASFGLGAQYRLSSGMILRGEVLHDRFKMDTNTGGGAFSAGVTDEGNSYDFGYLTGDGPVQRVRANSTALRIAAIWQF